jgi:ribonuclease-3
MASNERLEFLGDAVLDLVVAEFLIALYPEKDEGWLTQARSTLVDEDALTEKAVVMGLGDFIILGKSEEEAGGRGKSSILSGAFEALVGAMFLDGGYASPRGFIEKTFHEDFLNVRDYDPKNYKSRLQEILQKKMMPLPRYSIIKTSGPDHKRLFVCSVSVGGEEWGRGEGRTKKDAEMAAAKDALER